MIDERRSGLANALAAVRAWQPPQWARTILPIAALALAAASQRWADQRKGGSWTLLAYLLGAALYAIAVLRLPQERAAAEQRPRQRVNATWGLWALVFGVLAFASAGGNRFTPLNIAPWLVAMLLYILAFSSARDEATPRPWYRRATTFLQSGEWRISWPIVGLAAAILVGAYLRLYRLLEIPADLGWDLPYNYFDVQRILRGEHLVFFPDNYGREGMFFYLAAALARVVGLSPYSIRLASALVGIVTIPAIYLLAQECLNREAAVYAAWLLALNKWHIVLTRSGYRVSLLPLFAILVAYGLARALRRGMLRDWAWCGLFLGLGLWTYKAFIFTIPLVWGCAALYLWLPRSSKASPCEQSDAIQGRHWLHAPAMIGRGLGVLLCGMAIGAVPMLRFMIDSPDVYLARERQGILLVNRSVEGTPDRWRVYAQNAVTSVLMFNYEGDANNRFGVPRQRHLGYVSGVLFVLGLAMALSRWRRGGNALLVCSMLGFLLPMTVSMLAGEKPNCFRSAGTIGPALVLGAMALCALRQGAAGLMERLKRQWLSVQLVAGRDLETQPRQMNLRINLNLALLPMALVALLFIAEWRETGRFYFHDFRRQAPDVANYSVALRMAEKIIAFTDGPTYIKVWPHWYDGRAVRAHLDAAGRTWTAELPELSRDKPPLDSFQGRLLMLLHPLDSTSLQILREHFFRHTVLVERYPNGQPSIIVFYGER